MVPFDLMLLSIITVTKDDVRGLERTLASTVALRRQGVEQLVVDGTTDPAQRMQVSNLCSQNSVAVRHLPPTGIADAFNEGLNGARGRWIWFLNGGDAVHELLDTSWLLLLLSRSRSDIITGTVHFDGEGAARVTPFLNYQWPLVACWIAHPATLVTREKLMQQGGFDPRWKVAMDYDMWIRIVRQKCVMDVLSLPLARFDVTGVSEHPNTRSKAEREAARLVVHHAAGFILDSFWSLLRVHKRILFAVVRLIIPGR